MSSRSAHERVKDILKAIDSIQSQTNSMGFNEFC
jgi:uncharacterized protein with HEPN domain